MKRIFLIVLDSFGIGAMPDSESFGDVGVNTLAACATSDKLNIPNMIAAGLGSIDGVSCLPRTDAPTGAFARLTESSMGKDTTIGHWEIAGVVSPNPLPTYPNGFPEEVLKAFEEATGRGCLCNLPYSGTDVIRDYGQEQLDTGKWIVYTSADSVFQVAAHEEFIPLEELYDACHKARNILRGKHGVGRVIARPFVGDSINGFKRTSNRHDYSLEPPKMTMLDAIKAAGLDSIAVGKIHDIFAGYGDTEYVYNTSNANGMEHAAHYAARDFTGLCFVNLVDFDMLFGHRRDIDQLLQIFETPNIFERELQLDKFKWNKISDLTMYHYFDMDVILAFLAKAKIVKRWLDLDKESGAKLFEELVNEVRGTFKGINFNSK